MKQVEKEVIEYTMDRCRSVVISNLEIMQLPQKDFVLMLNRAFKEIESKEGDFTKVVVTDILISEEITPYFLKSGMDFYDESTHKEFLSTGIHGSIWTASVKVVNGLEHMIVLTEPLSDFTFLSKNNK